MSHRLLRLVSLCLTAAALTAVSGCGLPAATSGQGISGHVSSPPQGNTEPGKLPYVREVTKTRQFLYTVDDIPSYKYGFLTQSCASGETAISGGFSLSFGNTPDPVTRVVPAAVITESYPANTGWRITFEYMGNIQATIYANCFGNPAAKVSIFEQDFAAPARQPDTGVLVGCPKGSLAIGGGFSVQFPIAVKGSAPFPAFNNSSNIWTATFYNDSSFIDSSGEAVIVVCYGAVIADKLVEADSHPPNNPSNLLASCPEGWTLTTGGFFGVGVLVNAPEANDTQWELDAGSADLSVECAQFS